MLGGEGGHEVREDRHILRPGICEVRLIDLLHGTVDDLSLIHISPGNTKT